MQGSDILASPLIRQRIHVRRRKLIALVGKAVLGCPFAALARQAVLVAGDPVNPATRATRDRLMMAGFGEVVVMAGGAQAAAA